MEHWKGDIPVDATGRELWEYSTHGSCWLQELGLCDARQRRALSRSWLARSDCPLVWGWKPEDRLVEAPICLQNSFQNRETNCGPLSETTSTGRPWIRKMWSTTTCAVSLAEGVWAREQNGPPWRSGPPPSESRCCLSMGKARDKIKGQVWPRTRGNGQRLQQTNRRLVRSLIWAHTEQANTNCLTSWAMDGHQNRWRVAASDLRTPGWQVTLDSWTPPEDLRPQRSRHKQPTLRTPPRDLPLPHGILYPLLNIPREGSHHHPLGRMVSGATSLPGPSNRWERASGLVFLETGRYEREKLTAQRRVPSGPGEHSTSWPNGYIPSSCDPSRPRRAALLPPTSGATPPEPAWLPAAPCYLCHNFVLQGSGGERKRHRVHLLISRDRWDRTAPTPTSETSTSTINCRSGSGRQRTGAEMKRDLRTSKASWAWEFHLNGTLGEVSAVKGAATRLKFRMNRL